MANHTIDYYINKFKHYYAKANAFRVKAAKFYAEACNRNDLQARHAFELIDEFKDWTPKQWRLLYLIGSGVILSEYLDCHNPGIAICMARFGVKFEDQLDIFENGLCMYTITGRTKVVSVERMKECHIAQVFISGGDKRDAEGQMQWLREHVRKSPEVLPGGIIRVGHACHINQEQLVGLLLDPENPPLAPQVLMSCAQTLIHRAERRES